MGIFDLTNYLDQIAQLKKTPPVLPNDPSASRTYDLVVLEPDQEDFDCWLEDNPNGWCFYIAGNSEFFGNNPFSGCFDCHEFPEAFKVYEGASDALVKYLYDWMFYNDCSYSMEGFIEFYSVGTKVDAINLLKSCPVIGTIYEIDEDKNIIATY